MIARHLMRQMRCRDGSIAALFSTTTQQSLTGTMKFPPIVHKTRSQQDMEKLGEWLARNRRAGDVLFLYGDLGCGKTCLARGFLRAYTQQQNLIVTSPTYLLVNTYDETSKLPIVYHVDLYRLEVVTGQDVIALGLKEAFEQGITLVEWPERFEKHSVPTERLDVRISYDEEDSEIRHVELQPIGGRWTNFLTYM
ncbi:hypothetical protein CCR75_001401 [Bremia lactucae]|uniref:tRNA threonylcarbamoyladenosine biosynthesis protein TsaE n=1 Tax=Bremia lactucae TaxID=4779 RepID=A0A976FLH9_BRELC|nr:hypothetical protein CCR75_001401 [Bremia lactucae]